MPSNQENIEAKLAAYVDGELSGAEREEIERHLAANPQHRKLMSELMQLSGMVKALPRAKAPADVLDSLQSQLERSALLGRPEELTGEPSYKIGFWTQFRAIAAIVILTIGLATVVYFVLPRNAPNIELANSKDAPAVIVEEQSKPAAEVARSVPMEIHSKSAGPVGGDLRKDEGAIAGKGGFTLHEKLDHDPVSADIRQTLAINGVREDAMYILVDTFNAPLANATVSNYLNFNRATWEQVPVAAGADGLIPNVVDAVTNPRQILDETQRRATAAANQRGYGGGLNDNAVASNAMEQQATQQQQRLGSQMDLSQSLPARNLAQQPFTYNTGNLIVARNLNRKQYAELNGLLQQGNVGTVSNFSRAVQTQQAASIPIPAPNAAPGALGPRLKIGDVVTLITTDPAAAATTTATLHIDPSGNLPLSDVGDVAANNLTLEELNQAIAQKYKDANVGKPVPVATTDGLKLLGREIDNNMAAGVAAAQAQEAKDDQPVDVVIIVRETPAQQVEQATAQPGQTNAAAKTSGEPSPASAPHPGALQVEAKPSTAPSTAPTTQP